MPIFPPAPSGLAYFRPLPREKGDVSAAVFGPGDEISGKYACGRQSKTQAEKKNTKPCDYTACFDRKKSRRRGGIDAQQKKNSRTPQNKAGKDQNNPAKPFFSESAGQRIPAMPKPIQQRIHLWTAQLLQGCLIGGRSLFELPNAVHLICRKLQRRGRGSPGILCVLHTV